MTTALAEMAQLDGVLLERELEFDDQDFRRISKLIYRRAGIVLAAHKRQMVYARLARRVKDHGLRRFADYIDLLESRPGAPEWEEFTNALTTNLTAFFREPHHFPLLHQHLIDKPGPIRIWCCAASTGEEAYSIAMVLCETFGADSDARIMATDIDTSALACARKGIYPLSRVAKMEERRIKRFFLRGKGAWEGSVRVSPELAAMVDFAPVNLIDAHWPVRGPFDAIFCRNVMIYFDKPTQARILARFAPLLKSDGLLFAGHSENFSYVSEKFRLRGQTVYGLASATVANAQGNSVI